MRPERGFEAEVGLAAHRAYELISTILGEKGRVRVEDLKRVERETGVPMKLLEELAEFRCRIGLAGVPVRVEVELSSSRLGVRGRLDLLEGDVPVEVKYRDRIGVEDLVQLALYAMILEERGLSVEVGYIDLLRPLKRVRVELDSGLRERALTALENTRLAILEPLHPRNPPCRLCDVKAQCTLFFKHLRWEEDGG